MVSSDVRAPRAGRIGMAYAVRVEELLDSVRVDPGDVLETTQPVSTNGLPDRVEEDIRLASTAGG